MRKLYLIGLITVFFSLNSYGQFDINGNKLSSHLSDSPKAKQNKSKFDIPSLEFKLDSFRALTEINHNNSAQAYPWISNDGNRIYFTEGCEASGEADKIYIAERVSANGGYSNIYPLENINFPDVDNMSAWLTDDELNIFYICRIDDSTRLTTIYHAKRDFITQNFSIPVKLSFNFSIKGFVSGTSLTQDLAQLFIYNSTYNSIFILNKTADDVYNLIDTLKIPEGYMVGPGKLTSDGLSFYLSLELNYSDKSDIYLLKRQSVNEKFDEIYYIDNIAINEPEKRSNQPMLSSEKNTLVFSKTYENSWDANDLFIAYNFTVITDTKTKLNTQQYVSIYPNPTCVDINILLKKFRHTADYCLFNSTGQLLSANTFNGNTQLNLSIYEKGIYILLIHDKELNQSSYHKIFKR